MVLQSKKKKWSFVSFQRLFYGIDGLNKVTMKEVLKETWIEKIGTFNINWHIKPPYSLHKF